MAQATHQSSKVSYEFTNNDNVISNYVFTFHPHVRRIKNLISKKYKIKKEDISKMSLLVSRAVFDNSKKNVAWALAKPCQGCSNAIEEYKIKKVFYTIKNNEYGVITRE